MGVLRDRGFEIAFYYANSNIDTYDEWVRRLDALRILAEHDQVPLYVAPYDHEAWRMAVAKGFEAEPERGARCTRCFGFSLFQTAQFAQANGFEAFTTSLTISPHKVSRIIFEAGRDAAWRVSTADCGGISISAPAFLEIDFKKRDGFLCSQRRAAVLGLYRQGYCGCEYGKKCCWATSKMRHYGRAK